MSLFLKPWGFNLEAITYPITIAVFNPDYVVKNHGVGKCFDDFLTPHQPKNGFLCLENTKIPVFMRSLEEYDNQIVPLGYQRIYSDTPVFTTEYLTLYKKECDTSFPEFLIIVYQKNFERNVVR